jgi:uncharacterized protein (DUF3820 family)
MEIPFGKYKWTEVSDLPDGYLQWLGTLDNLHLWEGLERAVHKELEDRGLEPVTGNWDGEE